MGIQKREQITLPPNTKGYTTGVTVIGLSTKRWVGICWMREKKGISRGRNSVGSGIAGSQAQMISERFTSAAVGNDDAVQERESFSR